MIRLLSELRVAGHAPPAGDADAAVNQAVAAHLRDAADHLQSVDPHPYRAASIRIAADSVAALPRSLRDIYREHGREGLDALPGIGPGIAAIIGDILSTRLAAEHAVKPAGRLPQPPVQLLLEADRGYRAQTSPARPGEAGHASELRMQRDGWNLRVFYSHSARAQELGRTRDWVVIVAARNDHPPSQHTVVTETRGKLAGRRVVRGREAACRSYYARASSAMRAAKR